MCRKVDRIRHHHVGQNKKESENQVIHSFSKVETRVLSAITWKHKENYYKRRNDQGSRERWVKASSSMNGQNQTILYELNKASWCNPLSFVISIY